MARTKGARDWDYPQKRDALLRRVTRHLARREAARPSMRQLAQASGVSLSTLTYYFGDRTKLMTAVLEAQRRSTTAESEAEQGVASDLAGCVLDFSHGLIGQLSSGDQIRAGDVFAVGLAEGLLDGEIGPATLSNLLEPPLRELAGRFEQHIARGDMVDCDARAASLMLYSSLLMLVLHQDQLGGAQIAPVDREKARESLCDAFLRAYGPPQRAA